MPKKMKAALVTAFDRPLEIVEIAVPEVGPGEVLVRVNVCGVCFTDVSVSAGEWPIQSPLPFIPGHEGVGVVAAVGAGVSHVKEGDRVGVPFMYSTCGRGEYCATGWETLCPQQQMTGYTKNGCFAEFVVADAAYVVPIPDGLDFGEAAPLLCAGITTYKAIKQTEVRPGQWIVISGIGGLGHMAVQYARAMGLKCAAVDVSDEKLGLADELGAELTINAKDNPEQRIHAAIGGAHGVVVTAAAGRAFTQGVGFLRPHGTMVQVGVPHGDVQFPAFQAILQGLTVRGSVIGTRQDMKEALQFAVEGKVKSHFTWDSLDNVNDIFTQLRAGHVDGRIVMRIE